MAKLVKSFRSTYPFISAGVGIKDGSFASNDFWDNVKIREDRFIAFPPGTLSLARAILHFLLVSIKTLYVLTESFRYFHCSFL